MRIIAGTNRGMKLASPEGMVSRPITDRVKESLFNVLQKYDLPAGKTVADLFAGVGSLGLEALSRGAAYVTFVEQNVKVAEMLKRNIEKAGYIEQSKVLQADAFKFGLSPDGSHCEYDVAFVDPPYVDSARTQGDSPLSTLLTRLEGCIKPGGFVIVRTSRGTKLSQNYGGIETIETREWGTMAVTIMRCKKDG